MIFTTSAFVVVALCLAVLVIGLFLGYKVGRFIGRWTVDD